VGCSRWVEQRIQGEKKPHRFQLNVLSTGECNTELSKRGVSDQTSCKMERDYTQGLLLETLPGGICHLSGEGAEGGN